MLENVSEPPLKLDQGQPRRRRGGDHKRGEGRRRGHRGRGEERQADECTVR